METVNLQDLVTAFEKLAAQFAEAKASEIAPAEASAEVSAPIAEDSPVPEEDEEPSAPTGVKVVLGAIDNVRQVLKTIPSAELLAARSAFQAEAGKGTKHRRELIQAVINRIDRIVG